MSAGSAGATVDAVAASGRAASPTGPATPLLEARGIVKHYGGVQALGGADFVVHPGEIVALIGDNGAGKSTLTKVLAGTVIPDEGEILLDGEPIRPTGPAEVQALGIETVYQDLAIAPDLSPAANLYLGRELIRGGAIGRMLGLLDGPRMAREAQQAFKRLGVTLKDPTAPVATLSGGQRQSIAVARAAVWASKLIILDEPTAALGVKQTGRVLDLIRRVRDSGIAVVLISHNMTDVMAVSDRVEVLRLGQRVAQFRAGEMDIERLVAAMTGGVAEASARSALAADDAAAVDHAAADDESREGDA